MRVDDAHQALLKSSSGSSGVQFNCILSRMVSSATQNIFSDNGMQSHDLTSNSSYLMDVVHRLRQLAYLNFLVHSCGIGVSRYSAVQEIRDLIYFKNYLL